MKKSKLLLISWVLSALYLLYLVYYFTNGISTLTGAEQAGAGIASAIVTPHAIAVLIALVFNLLGWAMNHRGFTLTGAILYAVSIALFPPYFFFVIIQMILSFVGYAKMKNQPEKVELVEKSV